MNLYYHLYATGSVLHVSNNCNRYILKLRLIIIGRTKIAAYFYANVFSDYLALYKYFMLNGKESVRIRAIL